MEVKEPEVCTRCRLGQHHHVLGAKDCTCTHKGHGRPLRRKRNEEDKT